MGDFRVASEGTSLANPIGRPGREKSAPSWYNTGCWRSWIDYFMSESLYALSPLDGRYADKTEVLRPFLSEWALMKYRLKWNCAGCSPCLKQAGVTHVRQFTAGEKTLLASLDAEFGRLRGTAHQGSNEARTKHDVKAVEYYLRERLREGSLCDVEASAHFACTSDDINNLAYAMMFRDAMRAVWQPAARAVSAQIASLARGAAATPMLARTHGQAATPTTLGKELAVFQHRLGRQIKQGGGARVSGQVQWRDRRL